MRAASSFESRKIDGWTFLFAGCAAAMGATAQTPRLETLTQWLNASRKTRELALQPCLERIRAMDPSIHAWVQVAPQRPTGNGKLSEIPFGAKEFATLFPCTAPEAIRSPRRPQFRRLGRFIPIVEKLVERHFQRTASDTASS